MQNFVIFILAALGVWKTAHCVASFIEEQCLHEQQRRYLQDKFETWWFKVGEMPSRDFAIAVARAASAILDKYFGERFLSGKAFLRSSIFAIGLLAASLAGMSVAGVGVRPWSDFDDGMKLLEQPSLKQTKATEENETVENKKLREELKARQLLYAQHFKSSSWKALYCIFFFISLTIANSIVFSLSVALSRLTLQEIVLSGRVFSTVALLTLNLFLITLVSTFYLLFVCLLSQPYLWQAMSMLIEISLSVALVIGIGSGAITWFFAGPTSIILTAIGTVPFLATVLICFGSMVTLWNRERFHQLTGWFLLRCVDKKPVSFVVGFFGLVFVFIATIGWIWSAMFR